MAEAISCQGRCHHIIDHGKDKGRICGQVADHTNHAVWHYFAPTCTHTFPAQSSAAAETVTTGGE